MRKANVFLVTGSEDTAKIFGEDRLFFEQLAGASDLTIQSGQEGIPDGALSVILPFGTFFIPMQDLIDLAAEIARLTKEADRLQGELARSAKMLSNERFLAKAPEAKVAGEKEKQKNYELQFNSVKEQLEQLKKLQK